MRYCDDAHCPKFVGQDCKLGLDVIFRSPKTYQDINTYNWGWVMPKDCILNVPAREKNVKGGSLKDQLSKMEHKTKRTG